MFVFWGFEPLIYFDDIYLSEVTQFYASDTYLILSYLRKTDQGTLGALPTELFSEEKSDSNRRQPA